MKRFLFAAALVALVASAGSAEDKPAAKPTPAPATPVVVAPAGTPVVEYAPAPAQRRGLFGRLRNRNTGTTTYSPAPIVTAPAVAPTPATPMPPVVPPAPMPMPTVKPAGAVVPATGNLPAGRYTTTDGTIVQIGGTQPTAMTTETTTTSGERRGFLGRLRNR